MAQILAHPIKVLASRIRSVSAGNFDERIEIIRHDEIGRLIRSFNDMTKKLKKAKARERLSAIGEASAWIAHEFKNSLVAIKPFVQLFPRKHKDKEFVETFGKLVPQEIKRWESMLKDLSDFSSNFELNLVKTKVRDIINSILKPMEEEFMQKKIVVQYNSEENNLYLDADPERLRQVFMNLIINAIKAMPLGGSLIISEHLIKDNIVNNKPSYLEISIKDTGLGIPKDSLDKLFEPFHPTRKVGGMGLGLTISRRIIEQHGGKIDVESKIGIGTIFIVRLPIQSTSEIKTGKFIL
jgi:two-component system sporulation sensor kinase A